MNNNYIGLLDTSIYSKNIGDQIIMDSIIVELADIFREYFFLSVPTHNYLTKANYLEMKNTILQFLCGTNLLSSNMNSYNQWKVNLLDILYLKNIILIGVGWWKYQGNPNLYTSFLLNKLLSRTYIHSVRDNYTLEKMNLMGIKNVINTGCPTLWRLDGDHCLKIPKKKSKNVIITFTDYNQNYKLDQRFFQIVYYNYEYVYIWIQGSRDYAYIKSIISNYDKKKIIIVSPTLKSYDLILSSHIDIDYIGTRLHAGIRAMQHKRRSIIISIDNRTIEMSKDFNLNVIPRSEIEKLKYKINEEVVTNITLDLDAIDLWKKQFSRDF